MLPNQTTSSAGDGNKYDFIFQDPPKHKRALLPANGSRKQRLIIVGGGAVALLLFFVIIFAVIFSSGGSPLQPMLQLAQSQNEIIRVSTAGDSKIRSGPVQDFAQNTLTSTLSAQQRTVAYITDQGQKVDPKQLALAQNTATDETLKAAEQAGNYDTVFYNTLYKQVVAYRSQLAEAYKSAHSAKQKQLLKQLYDSTTTLLQNQPQPATN